MKRVLLATYEYPPDVGGIAEYLSGLVFALPYETTVLKLKNRKFPLGWLADLPAMWSAIRKNKPELLIVSHLLPLGTAAMFLSHLTGVKYAVIVHGTDLKRASSDPRKSELARRVLGKAAFVAANSNFTRGLATHAGASEERSVVVYPCPGHAHAATGDGIAIRKRHGLEGKKVILTVARLVARKGIDHLLDVLPTLRQQCGDIALLVVGSGPELDRLKTLAWGRHIEKHVIFAGRVSDEDLPSYFSAADVFALVGHEESDDVEGFGLVYLEAALHGLASVASRTGGAPEAVVSGQTGIVVNSDAPDVLFAALCELLTDVPRAVKMGEWGRARVLGEFTWEKQAAKFAHMADAL